MKDHIRQLIKFHANIQAANPYAYFELARTKVTDWMAWVCSHQSETHPQRTVYCSGQGLTPDEACKNALDALGKSSDATVVKARTSDPSTSHAAAASVDDLRAKQKAVLEVFQLPDNCGMTDGELIEEYWKLHIMNPQVKQSESGIRSRRSELVALEFLEDSGITGFTESNRPTTIWRLKR